MNPDGTHTPQEAGRAIALLKTGLLKPYKIVGHMPSGTAAVLSQALRGAPDSADLFLAQFRPVPPDIKGQEFQTLTEMLKVFREFHPTEDWLLVITGKTSEAVVLTEPDPRGPERKSTGQSLGFVDTPMLEKAIQWHTSQGHKGEI